MQRLAREIVTIIVDEYGTDAFLKRVSDPFWFSARVISIGFGQIITKVLDNSPTHYMCEV
jgi:hypothetical protein